MVHIKFIAVNVAKMYLYKTILKVEIAFVCLFALEQDLDLKNNICISNSQCGNNILIALSHVYFDKCRQ